MTAAQQRQQPIHAGKLNLCKDYTNASSEARDHLTRKN